MIWEVLSKVLNKKGTVISSLNLINVIFMFDITISYFSRFSDALGTDINSAEIFRIVIQYHIIVLFISKIDNNNILRIKDYIYIFIVYYVGILFISMFSNSFTGPIKHILQHSDFCLLTLIILFYFYILRKTTIENLDCIEYDLSLLFWFPFLAIFLLENLYILNNRGVFLKNYRSIIMTAMLMCCIAIFFRLRKSIRSNTVLSRSLNLGWIGAICSMVAVKYSCNYKIECEFDMYNGIYELGNKTVVLDSLLHGELPVLDYFSAHPLNDIITRYIYVFANGELNGVYTDIYQGLKVLISLVLSYIVLKEFVKAEYAVLFIMLAPIGMQGLNWSGLHFITLVAFINLLKKTTTGSYYIFWISCLFGAFTSYDSGVYLGVACIIVIMLLCFKDNKLSIKSFVFSGFVVGLIFIALCAGYCFKTDINIRARLMEWLSLTINSNETWARTLFGDATTVNFYIVYFMINLYVVYSAGRMIYRYTKTESIPSQCAIIFVFIITMILFVPRTIIFHNLSTGRMSGVMLNFLPWLIFTQTSLAQKNQEDRFKKSVFVFCVITIMLSVVVLQRVPVNGDSYFISALSKSRKICINNDMTEIHGEGRVTLGEESAAYVEEYKKVFDLLLNDNETYIDFCNMSALYTLVERERPSYVSQTPSLLTDLYSQECFLEGLLEYNCPLALVGIEDEKYLLKMAGVQHNVRYYKVAEYIYFNYRPLLDMGDVAVWCLKDDYEKYYNILCNDKELNSKLVDYGYDECEVLYEEDIIKYEFKKMLHKYDLEKLPYVWANYSELDSHNNKELLSPTRILDENYRSVYCCETTDNIDKTQGNYLLCKIENIGNEEERVVIYLSDSEDIKRTYAYVFQVMPGEYEYLIRISSDYYWYAYDIDTIEIKTSSKKVEIKTVKILEGD